MIKGLLKQGALRREWARGEYDSRVDVATLESLRERISRECKYNASPIEAACLIIIMEYVRDDLLGGPEDGVGEYGPPDPFHIGLSTV